VSTWIEKLDGGGGDGVRLAVKDLIDVAGVPTTAGCRALALRAEPATTDAPLLAGARAAGARIVGKTNLHELAFGTTGVNEWYGTPVNPADPALVPGGSSSGSAVAVGSGEADVAFGSDTGGSVRIPAACTGTVGLKTTWGRVALAGVWPLSPSLDTIGPMARDVAGTAVGMALLEPGFTMAAAAPRVVGRFRGLSAEDGVDEAVDRALAEAGFEVVDVALPGWEAASTHAYTLLLSEAWAADRALIEATGGQGVSGPIQARLQLGAAIDDAAVARSWAAQSAWQEELAEVFRRVEVIALPTLVRTPPRVDAAEETHLTTATVPFNFSGHPGLALPVPRPGAPVPASLQLVGPHGSEDLLLAAGAVVEAAVG
jgi:amidase